MNSPHSWQVFAFASALCAGATALLSKIGLSSINSNLATLIRVCFILVLCVAIVCATHQWQSPRDISFTTWMFLALSAFTTAISWLCYYHALQLGPVSKVASIDKLSLAVSIALGVLVLGEKCSWQVLVGAGLIMAGAILIVT